MSFSLFVTLQYCYEPNDTPVSVVERDFLANYDVACHEKFDTPALSCKKTHPIIIL